MTQSSSNNSFSLLIKPSSSDCNLRCGYCFYLEKSALYPDKSVHRMNSGTLRAMIGKFMKLGMAQNIFGWQGGEPLLMGVDFFREAVKLQAELGREGQSVANSVQTNGVLLDGEWLDLFTEFKFLVGLSIDGPANVHDRNRFTSSGRSVFAEVIKAAKLMQRYGTQFNVLTVISQANKLDAAGTYKFVKELGVNHHQYIPAISTPESIACGKNFGVTGQEYGKFLLDLFEAWYPHDVRRVSIRFFDSVVNQLVNGIPYYCEMGANCSEYFVVEYNGDIYPCDFFVEPKMKLGNINTASFEDLRVSPLYRKFARMKSNYDNCCSECEFLAFCHGGCTRHRNYASVTSKGRTVLCEGLKMFYKETMPVFKQLASTVGK